MADGCGEHSALIFHLPDNSRHITKGLPAMSSTMALPAKCDQISFTIRATATPGVDMVHFQLYATAAHLAAPSIALEYLTTQLVVLGGLKPKPRVLWEAQHDMPPRTGVAGAR
jgi:hypothetical protein